MSKPTGEKRGFWKRLSTKSSKHPAMAPAAGADKTLPPRSFKEFDQGADDAWSDGEEDPDAYAMDAAGGIADLSLKNTAKGGDRQRAQTLNSNTQNTQTPTRPSRSDSTPPGVPSSLLSAFGRRRTKSDKAGAKAPASPSKGKSSSPATPSKLPRKQIPPHTPLSQTDASERAGQIGCRAASGNTSQTQERDDPARIAKFNALLDADNLDLEVLRELSWSGVPAVVRPMTWMLLSVRSNADLAHAHALNMTAKAPELSCRKHGPRTSHGYVPVNVDRRETTLTRKREEYMGFVGTYWETRHQEGDNKKTFHQIQIDLPRTNPAPLFQLDVVMRLLERILYVWALRHPGSGYVQGMNDLVTPFFAVFLKPYLEADTDVESTETLSVDEKILNEIEADSYWCLTKLLDGIQDNYIASQPGIQKRIIALSELVTRVDGQLHKHLADHCIEYMQFSFRWMNCLLMREMPLRCAIRLWDTYHAEADGFASFHLYACAAFLVTFSKQLRAQTDFQGIIMLLQKPPTENWTQREIALLLAEAFSWKSMFHGAQAHFTN